MHCKRLTILQAAVIVVMTAIGLAACSTKKNNAATRNYQAFITRYNIYYNGDTHYKETLAEMERSYEDDYSGRVLMHPVEAKNNPSAPQPAGDFTRSIEKGQKAIQLRSIKKKPARKSGKGNDAAYKAWMKRDEYNPFLHNAWLMMGRGQFYNGDFMGAASTFFYTSRHFSWLPKVVTEAKLMQALSYISMGWQFEAEVIITRIKEDELTDKHLRNLYNFVYADFHLHAGDDKAAVPFLEAAIKGASGAQKTRLRFLLGQVYQALGDKQRAYKAFAAAGSSSSTSYRTKFNARIKQSEVYDGADFEKEVRALRRMTRYDRNKDYQDQIYYAIGNIYLTHGDTAKAIENYELANEKSTRGGIEKAINQLSLGALYFQQGHYDKAQPNYAEAVPLLSTTYPDYENIKRRSDVLDELAVYSQNVTLQDSLLRLAAMPEEQRNAIIDRIIADLKQKEKEEAEEAARQEFLANEAANNNGLQDKASKSFTINSDNSWYFYNTATKNAGKTEFQKRWGARKLEDDWRRRNKSSFNTDDFAPEDEDSQNDSIQDTGPEIPDEEKEKAEHTADPHFPEYYLAQIPFSEQDKMTANDIIQDGLYNMGVILKDKLDDPRAALREFNRLLTDYPDNIYRLDTYYNIYLMAMRGGDEALAEHYRQLILRDFGESKYGIALRDSDYIENLRRMDEVQQALYDDAYLAYLENRNADVHSAYATMNEKYPLSKIMPKFMFLHALAYVTDKDSEAFNSVLRDLLERYPDTDITPVASAWLKGMAQGRKLQSGSGGNMRGMLWDLRLTNDSTVTANDSIAGFTLDDNAGQSLVFLFPTDKVSSNGLLFEIARHNFRSFVVKDFDLEQMNFGRLGMIVVRGFANMGELNHYRSVMAASPDFKLPPSVRPVVISDANLKLMLEQGRSFEEYFRYLDEQNYIDAQADLLAPEEIETLDEADEAAEHNQPENSGLPSNREKSETSEEPTPAPTPAPARPAVQTPAPAPAEPKPTTRPTILLPDEDNEP